MANQAQNTLQPGSVALTTEDQQKFCTACFSGSQQTELFCLIVCVDGLKGFPDAVNTVYPQTKIQLRIVHMVRNSLKYVSWKEQKTLCAELKC